MRWESTFIRSSSVFNDTRFPHKVHKCTEQTPTCCKIRSDFSLLFVQHPFMRFKQLKYIVSVQTANFVAMKFILCVSVLGAVQCAVRTVAHALLSIPADRCKDATNVVCVFFPIAEVIVKQNCRLTNKLLRQNIRIHTLRIFAEAMTWTCVFHIHVNLFPIQNKNIIHFTILFDLRLASVPKIHSMNSTNQTILRLNQVQRGNWRQR